MAMLITGIFQSKLQFIWVCSPGVKSFLAGAFIIAITVMGPGGNSLRDKESTE